MNVTLVKRFSLGVTVALIVVCSIFFVEMTVLSGESGGFLCGIDLPITSEHGSGFIWSLPIGRYGMQYVIRPNSVATLQISYLANIILNESYTSNLSNFRWNPSWGKLGSKSASPPSQEDVGLFSTLVAATVTGNSTFTLTYEVTALANAQIGAYVGGFYSTCGTEIVITVGYFPYFGAGLYNGVYM